MYKLSETEIPNFKTLQPDDLDGMFNTLEHNWQAQLPFLKETLEKWCTRTQTLSLNKKSNQKGATILDHMNNVLSSENMAKQIEKVSLKRGGEKALGRLTSEHMQESDR